MNLWARTTLRQLTVLAVALFFFSCEDETSILGFPNPNKKFQVGYVDIPLNASSILAIDSLVTDLRPVLVNQQTITVDGILVGEYVDPAFGTINAKSFLPMYPTVGTALPATAQFDSITVQLRLNFYGYGFSGKDEKHLAIHEITGDTLSLFNGKRYYGSSPAPEYTSNPLGEAVVTVHYDSLLKLASLTSSQDTLLLAAGRLTDEFGLRVFDAIKAGLLTQEANRFFKSQIRGLAVLPVESDGVLGFNVVNTAGQQSRVILHYHTLTDAGAVKDTLVRTFGFDFSSFTKFEAERMGTELDGLQPYQSVNPLSDFRYIQSGAPIVTKFDLAPFYVFADSVENVLINEAQLIIDDVESPPGLRPHDALMFQLMNKSSDVFINSRIAADRELAAKYFAVPGLQAPGVPRGLENYYSAAIQNPGQAPVPATILYNSDTDQYSGFITIFAQSLLANKSDADGINENRLQYLALIPASPSATRGVTRTIFHKDNVKLRVFYTRAKTANQ